MNTRLYTVDEVIKNLVVLQSHLENVKQPLAFCMDCITKHLYELWKLGDEGAGFFSERPSPWQDLGVWCAKAVDLAAEDLSTKDRLMLAADARNLRKEVFVPIARAERGGSSKSAKGTAEKQTLKMIRERWPGLRAIPDNILELADDVIVDPSAGWYGSVKDGIITVRPDASERTVAHEFGHLIEEFGATIGFSGAEYREWKKIIRVEPVEFEAFGEDFPRVREKESFPAGYAQFVTGALTRDNAPLKYDFLVRTFGEVAALPHSPNAQLLEALSQAHGPSGDEGQKASPCPFCGE